jgi:hypothetical protein
MILILKKFSNENENNNEDEKYQFKRIFEMYENIGNKLDNNYNKINSNIYDSNKLNLLKNKFKNKENENFARIL